jgi:hypothetical protein
MGLDRLSGSVRTGATPSHIPGLALDLFGVTHVQVVGHVMPRQNSWHRAHLKVRGEDDTATEMR